MALRASGMTGRAGSAGHGPPIHSFLGVAGITDAEGLPRRDETPVFVDEFGQNRLLSHGARAC